MTLARTDILEKASKLYKQYGIRSATMEDIAAELGISKKTLYQYISDKEALIDMVLEADFSQMEKRLEKIIQQTDQPIEQFIRIQNIILQRLLVRSGLLSYELKKYYPGKYQQYLNKYMSLFTAILHQNLVAGIESDIFRKNLNAALIVKTHLTSVFSATDDSFVKKDDYLSKKYIVESLRYHLRAIVTKKHIDSIDNYLKSIKPVLS